MHILSLIRVKNCSKLLRELLLDLKPELPLLKLGVLEMPPQQKAKEAFQITDPFELLYFFRS